MVPLLNPSFEPKTHRWRPGAGAPSWAVPSQNCSFGAPKQPFLAQNGPDTKSNGQTKANGSYTPRAPQLPRDQEPFIAVQLHNMSGKRPKNGPKWPECALFVSNKPETKNGPYLGLRGSNSEFRGHLVHLQPPTFCGFQAQNHPTSHLDPRTSGHLVEPEGSPARARLGPTVGPPGSPGRKKDFFQSCS